jgi:hypothetical protein
MSLRLCGSAWLLLPVLVVACHEQAGPEPDDAPATDSEVEDADAATEDAAPEEPEQPEDAVEDSGGSVPDAASGAVLDAAGTPDDAGAEASVEVPGVKPGTGFENALRIEPGELAMLVNERAADQVDYFVFHAEAGSFYELTTDRSVFSPDNVITLYDAERKLLAYNDDGPLWPGDRLDARLIVHAAKTGDYFLKVEDPYTPPDFFGSEFGLLYYYLKVRAVTGETPGFARVLPDGSTAPTFQHDARTGYDYVTLLGLFGAESATCSFSGLAERALIAHVAQGGAEHDGSSFRAGHIQVTRADGSVLAEIDRALGQENIHPPIGADRYTVRLDSHGVALGDNPYYSLDLIQLPDNPAEQAEASNGALGGAEAVVLNNGAARRGLVLSRLPAGDVDYYRFELVSGDRVRVACEAESAGSGVRGLTAEIRNASDERLATASETSLENLAVEPLEVQAAGTYHLRLSSLAGSTAPIDPWVRCAILINR